MLSNRELLALVQDKIEQVKIDHAYPDSFEEYCFVDGQIEHLDRLKNHLVYGEDHARTWGNEGLLSDAEQHLRRRQWELKGARKALEFLTPLLQDDTVES